MNQPALECPAPAASGFDRLDRASIDVPRCLERASALRHPTARARQLPAVDVSFTGQAADDDCEAALALELSRRAEDMAAIAIEEERNRIALVLHDSVGSLLFAIGAAAGDLSSEADPGPLQARLTFIHQQATMAAAALREALRTLSETPVELALGVSLRGDCSAFEVRTGIRAGFVVLGDLPDLDPSRTAALLGATREALLNVEKHARASSVVVSLLRTDTGVMSVVADDGVGIPVEGERGEGLGLRGSANRLAQVGGGLAVVANEDGGTTVKAWVPTVPTWHGRLTDDAPDVVRAVGAGRSRRVGQRRLRVAVGAAAFEVQTAMAQS